MSSLGGVLESLFAGDDGAGPSVRAEASHRRDEVLVAEAQEKFAAVLQHTPRAARAVIPVLASVTTGAMRLRGGPDTPTGPTGPSTLRMWFQPNFKGRVDRIWDRDGASQHLATVVGPFTRFGHPAWKRSYDCERQVSLRRPWGWWAPSPHDLQQLFWRPTIRQLLEGVALEDPAEGEVAGRPVIRAGGRPRPQGTSLPWPQMPPFGADRYEVAFDRQYGYVLALDAQLDGRPFSSVHVTTVRYGEPIDEQVFDPVRSRNPPI